MNSHTRKLYDRITGSPAPRDLEWVQFVRFWEDVADGVEQESGDRLAVHINGHREVFRRQHDGVVPIDDIERARRALAASDPATGEGRLVIVAIDDERAQIIDVDLGTPPRDDTERTVTDHDRRARRLRTVERREGRDDAQVRDHFFDQVADALIAEPSDEPVVVLGHGHGKSSAGEAFVERLNAKHAAIAHRVRGVGDVDLSAANDADLEAAARAVLARG